ncbi:bifunctional 4-hydroxy-2-oxoglutarate aldolase/2-dehydro-3-deoxy-phosphogluconate aldolase [Ensifer sp. YR511]|uniref:bifunctional 4-hydroxy-2-oxoglutarate aldolase/2-dehydro-3-deoxy-phosphogluconate aldolase n=1 Tax=Ensifer sp. YR511 TaxID=1855294 RepID=UPI000881778F|nr:bifunctional 4-hydroxy-2-oxoglutarate aldolase/2-dehydro-3-deoxy-phosphogluconate aldolase [Ensifer sp. YR511]SDN04525.1 2-keto-3-deoxy-phosphogluconate aldolase [Ensifer sp. YR511]
MNVASADVATRIAVARILPVVVIDRVEDAVPLARALIEGGLPVAEITFRTEVAAEAIRQISADAPEMLVGAGTVLTTGNLDAARQAGAAFIVTPGFNPAIVAAARDAGMPIVPGVNNPTGIEQAMAAGLDIVKFFPAEPTGGVAFLKALMGPYGGMRFVPTGGIGPKNLASYLALPAVLACGGSWMVDPQLIRQGRFDEISRLTGEAVSLARAD